MLIAGIDVLVIQLMLNAFCLWIALNKTRLQELKQELKQKEVLLESMIHQKS